MKFYQEFKTFISRGSVVDLAVGIIIGGAFGKIVTSLVADIFMPPLGLLVGGVNFTDLKIRLKDAVTDAAGKVEVDAVTLNYGNFLQSVFDFLIVGFCIFLVIKAMNRLQRKSEELPPAPPAPSKEETLLGEIRDILKSK